METHNNSTKKWFDKPLKNRYQSLEELLDVEHTTYTYSSKSLKFIIVEVFETGI